MGRKDTRGTTFRVRYRGNLGAKSKLRFSTNGKKKPKGSGFGGKVLKVQKVSQEELLHTGEFNDLPEKLMKEFSEAKKNGTPPKSDYRESVAVPK